VRVILTFFSSWTNWIDLSKINWLRDVILLNLIVLVPWGKFSLCHTPIRPISAFRDQISLLIVGCVTTWSRGSHQLAFGLSPNLDKSSMFCVMLILILNYNFLMRSAIRKGSCRLGILVFLLLLQRFSWLFDPCGPNHG